MLPPERTPLEARLANGVPGLPCGLLTVTVTRRAHTHQRQTIQCELLFLFCNRSRADRRYIIRSKSRHEGSCCDDLSTLSVAQRPAAPAPSFERWNKNNLARHSTNIAAKAFTSLYSEVA